MARAELRGDPLRGRGRALGDQGGEDRGKKAHAHRPPAERTLQMNQSSNWVKKKGGGPDPSGSASARTARPETPASGDRAVAHRRAPPRPALPSLGKPVATTKAPTDDTETHCENSCSNHGYF